MVYLYWAIYKHREFIKGWRQWVYTGIIQVASDFAIMAGFIAGIDGIF